MRVKLEDVVYGSLTPNPDAVEDKEFLTVENQKLMDSTKWVQDVKIDKAGLVVESVLCDEVIVGNPRGN